MTHAETQATIEEMGEAVQVIVVAGCEAGTRPRSEPKTVDPHQAVPHWKNPLLTGVPLRNTQSYNF